MFLSLALGIILCGTAFFLFFTYLRIIKKGESITGEIYEIDDGSFTVKGGTFHSIWVQYIGQDETVQQMRSINGFILTPFREKHKLSKLRKNIWEKRYTDICFLGNFQSFSCGSSCGKTGSCACFCCFGDSSCFCLAFLYYYNFNMLSLF